MTAIALMACRSRGATVQPSGGHQRRFKRKSRTSAFTPIPDISLRRAARADQSADTRRIAANIANLPELLGRKD